MTLNRILFYNANLVLPDQVLANAALEIADGKIQAIFSAEEAAGRVRSTGSVMLNCNGDYLIPGLIDLHVHGCGGADIMDASSAAFEQMSACLMRRGTVAFLATTMTAATDRMARVFSAAESWLSRGGQAELLGFHLEGPCISNQYRGAQDYDPELCKSVDLPKSDRIRIITVAPELDEAQLWMHWATTNNIVISAGHSGAGYEKMCEMVDQFGISYLTHAFNAMSPIHHRNPGLLTAALLNERITIELIADGFHIHPAVLELAIRLKTPEKVVLVSDGTRATGMSDGQYELGGQTIHLRQGRLSLSNGTLAGSASSLLDGVKLISQGLNRPIHEAVRMATFNPALLLGLEQRLGSLLPMREATILRLTESLEIRQCWQKGNLIYSEIEGEMN